MVARAATWRRISTNGDVWANWSGLDEIELPSAGDGLGAPPDLELAEDDAIVPFYGIHREKESITDSAVREALGDEA